MDHKFFSLVSNTINISSNININSDHINDPCTIHCVPNYSSSIIIVKNSGSPHITSISPYPNQRVDSMSNFNNPSSLEDLNSITNNCLSLAPPSSNTFPSTIINLSSLKLDPPSLQLLDKGFNFTLDLRRIPVEEIICSIESITHNLLTQEPEEIG